ncbi:hypothetical protein Tco_0255329 [Tanacetum coccineum]
MFSTDVDLDYRHSLLKPISLWNYRKDHSLAPSAALDCVGLPSPISLPSAFLVLTVGEVTTASTKLLLLEEVTTASGITTAEGVNAASEEVSTAELVSTAYVICMRYFGKRYV